MQRIAIFEPMRDWIPSFRFKMALSSLIRSQFALDCVDGVQNRNHAVKNRNHAVKNRNHAVKNRNHAVKNRNDAVQNRNHAVQNRNDAVQNRNDTVQNRNDGVQNRNDGVQNRNHSIDAEGDRPLLAIGTLKPRIDTSSTGSHGNRKRPLR